jgi:hypothetical protein
VQLGHTKKGVLKYEEALKADKFVLIAHGSIENTTHAKEILDTTEHELLDHHK